MKYHPRIEHRSPIANAIFALALFTTGVAVGHFGLIPITAAAQPAIESEGAVGESFTWQQIDDLLQVTVAGSETSYLAIADLEDEHAWSDLGSADAEILYATDTFELDLSGVREMTFFRVEPVGTLSGGRFRPCIPAGCFPTRPPVDPPPPFLRFLYSYERQ